MQQNRRAENNEWPRQNNGSGKKENKESMETATSHCNKRICFVKVEHKNNEVFRSRKNFVKSGLTACSKAATDSALGKEQTRNYHNKKAFQE
jgi:hypothetical protein